MRSSQRRRGAGLLATLAIAGTALLAGSVGPVAAADPVTLSVGTTQDLDASNPFNTELVVGYEAFELTYSLLVDFDKDARPGPGFADSWERSPDRVTFKIGSGRKWSDGQPATSADVCYSWGLALAAQKAGSYVGSGYLDPGLTDAGVTKIECPDANTFVAYTTDQSERIYQIYVPIIPKHIWGKFDYKKIAEQKFDPPLVGTGPYTLAEWKTGQFARFVRNPNFWSSKQGFEDEVVMRFFPDNSDTMVQAFKNGELDYVHDINNDQFAQLKADPTYTTVAGKPNGWTQLAFNQYGSDGRAKIKGGGPSTEALLDPAFRDALGYATDKQTLVDRVLGGNGTPGDTVIPPVLVDWHVAPDKPRKFDIELAKQKLDAAGYKLVDGKRMDKQNKAINLRLYYPNTNDIYPKTAAFIKEWYGQLGIGVTEKSFDSDTLTGIVLPPESEEADALAKYDIELWGWSGSPDPNGLLYIFLCNQIGSSSDSQWCSKDYDALYAKESKEAGAERKATLTQLQNLVYDQAVYDVLYYDDNLDAHRNDKFAGWQNQPSNGTPFFSYGTLNYTLLTDATLVPTPGPSVAAPSTGASAAPGATNPPSTGGTSGGGDNTPLLILLVVAVAVVVGGWLMYRRRSAPKLEEE